MKGNTVHISESVEGTIQGAQVPLALDPGHFLVDERDAAQLMAFYVRLSSQLQYFTSTNKPDGTWESFLLADVSALSAYVAQTPHHADLNRFIEFYKAIGAAKGWHMQKYFAQHFFNTAFDVVLKINYWYQLSNQNFSINAVTHYLKDIIQETAVPALAEFYSYYFYLTETLSSFKNEALRKFQELDPIWNFSPFPRTEHIKISSQEEEYILSDIVKEALTSGQQILSAQADIVTQAKEIFNQSLQRKDIPPHIALLLVFLDLFRHHQTAINTITERHLNFNYCSVLGFTPAKAVADTTFLSFQLMKGISELYLPEGTGFSAGKDPEGNPIVFSTTSSIDINTAKVAQYLTLLFSQQQDSPLLSGIYSGSVTSPDVIGNPEWPLFGAAGSGRNYQSQQAELGFAFSCPDLLLSEGSRAVSIDFMLTTEGSQAIEEIKSIVGASLLNYYIATFFEPQITSSAGWKDMPIDAVLYDETSGILTFQINLLPSDPAAIAYSEKLHGSGFDSIWPVCKVWLTEEGKAFYPQLKLLSISSISCHAVVSGITNFQLQSDSTKLSPVHPFFPFLAPGDHLYFSLQELFIKPIDTIQLTIEWDQLPASFKSYYQRYNEYYQENKIPFVFENQVFQGEVSLLVNGSWKKISDNEKIYFFTDIPTSDQEAPIVGDNRKIISIDGSELPCDPYLPYPSELSSATSEGYLRLTFTNPVQGFGASDYPNVVSATTLENSLIAMHNARILAFHKKEFKLIPSTPFIPKINRMELGYTSIGNQEITPSLNTLQWYHLHPFGIEQVSFNNNTLSVLPYYAKHGYMYLNLEQTLPEKMTTLFCALNNRTKSVTNTGNQNVSHEYLTDEGWKPLPVFKDSTEGFQKTGIITFTIPQDFTQSTSFMPPGNWIRISQTSTSDVKAYYLSTQAVEVTRKLEDLSQSVVSIPAGIITKPVIDTSGLKSIVQPVASAGGKPAQSVKQFYHQSASRIRYKNRIGSFSDLEQLLLNNFPALYKVTAIPGGSRGPIPAGTVKIIVVPITESSEASSYRPYASADLMLEVLDFVNAHGMPSMNYEVSNPDFDTIQISCDLKFTEEDTQALAKQLNSDIINFFSPWIKDNPFRSMLPLTYTPASLYTFISTRPYVLYANNLLYQQMSDVQRQDYVIKIGDAPMSRAQVIRPSNAWSILVSSDQHIIRVLENGNNNLSSGSKKSGIRIGENFYLNK